MQCAWRTKADRAQEESYAVQDDAAGAGMLMLAISDPGYVEHLLEERAPLAKHVNGAHTKTRAPLVRELAQGHDQPFSAAAIGVRWPSSPLGWARVPPRRRVAGH